jgi:hypothetical protein
MKKFFFAVLIVIGSCMTASAAVVTDTFQASTTPVCPASIPTTTAANNGNENYTCLNTPNTFEITVYEIGACAADPYAAGGQAIDKSSCTVVFTNTAGSTLDVATSIGGSSGLTGTITRPVNGTYKYPYAVISNSLKIDAVVTQNAVTYSSSGTEGTVTTNGTGITPQTETFLNFDGNGSTCAAVISGLPVSNGTMTGHLTDAALNRRDATDSSGNANNKICTGVARLVAVNTLTTPFVVTKDTTYFKLGFNVTNSGVLIENDNSGAIEQINSQPFSILLTSD